MPTPPPLGGYDPLAGILFWLVLCALCLCVLVLVVVAIVVFAAWRSQKGGNMRKTLYLLLVIVLSIGLLGMARPGAGSRNTACRCAKRWCWKAAESTNPRDYDPATTGTSGDKRLFSGLVSFDPRLNLVPDLAERWEVSPDGTVYTFFLRKNARFHNGRPVTAQDVIYSWTRAADPKLQSPTVLTYLGDIVGIREVNEGRAASVSGLKALDDHTLQVTIDAPKPYFLMKLTYPTAFVVDKANVESGPGGTASRTPPALTN